MKKGIFLIFVVLLTSCISVPKESVTLSETLGKDLKTLKSSHINTINIFYGNLEEKVNRFIDEVYAPFIIQYVLEREFENFENGDASIITSLEKASQEDATQADTEKALQDMVDFQQLATDQIAQKRSELLNPIIQEKTEILKKINKSYNNAIYANSTLTGYLKSVKEVKRTQKESLSILGLEGADEELDQAMLRASDVLDEVIQQGRIIDKDAGDARDKINVLIEKIKNITSP